MKMKQHIIDEKDWKRGEILGKGGFGSVFVATSSTNHPILPPITAVKSSLMNNPVGGGDDTDEQHSSPASWLVREGKILAQLQGCPHIIGFYGSGFSSEEQETGRCFFFNLFLQLATLGSLSDRIQQHPFGLPEFEVIHYTRCVLQGLIHIHQNNFVHCDLKPDNILLDIPFFPLGYVPNDVVPKIADFGLAKEVGEPMVMEESELWGTSYYMAPESINFDEYEPPADIWALGCIVFEMLTGKRAWRCDANTPVSSLLHRIGYTKELPIIPTKVSAQARDFLNKCLVKDPALRWTADMLLDHSFLAIQNIQPKISNDKTASRPVDLHWLPQAEFIDLTTSSQSCKSKKRQRDAYERVDTSREAITYQERKRWKMAEDAREVIDLSSGIHVANIFGMPPVRELVFV